MPIEVTKATCAVCGKEAGLMCQRCAEPYCSDVCQHSDWQRHKYFCIVMPPLVTCIGLKPKPKPIVESKVENLAMKVKETPSVPIALSKNWRDHMKLPVGGEYFECLVLHKEQNGIIWLMEVANIKIMEHFSEKMTEAMRKRKPCVRIEDLSVDALVGVNAENKFFRGQVRCLHPKLKQADVCLFDHGPVFTTALDNIYLPLTPMAETKAFAFRVKLPSAEGADEMLQVNKKVKLRLLGTKTHEGIYHVQLKHKLSIPLNLPINFLMEKATVNVIHIFEPKVALLQMKALDSLNDDLNDALIDNMQFTEPLPKAPKTFFVAANTQVGYRRAFLLDYIEQPTQRYLVYEMDEGRVTVTNELRRIPNDLVAHPMRAFAITLTKGSFREMGNQTASASDNDLNIKFVSDDSEGKPEKRSANVMLLGGSNGQEIYKGLVQTFCGRLADLGLKFWLDPQLVGSGQLVFITRVFNNGELCVSSVETKKYAEIFCHLEGKCKPFADSNDIAVGSIVLVLWPSQAHFRAEVIKAQGNGRYTVRNIDSGHKHEVSGNNLRTSCPFLDHMPVSLARIKLKTICDIPMAAVPANNVARQTLEQLCAEKDEFIIQFTDSNFEIADLLTAKEQTSLVNRLLPLIFTTHKKEEDSIKAPSIVVVTPDTESDKLPSLPSSPASSVKSISLTKSPIGDKSSFVERFYFRNMKLNLIPVGESLEIMLLNSVGMHKTGFITSCYFSNDRDVEIFQSVLDLVEEYGRDKKNKIIDYVPEIGEMCISLFKDDMKWYRGICQEIWGDKVNILYCDFGNSEFVPLKWIKPITGNLAKSGFATKCYIKGFEKDKDFRLVENYLVKQMKLICNVEEGPEPNTRSLTIIDLDKILSKELS